MRRRLGCASRHEERCRSLEIKKRVEQVIVSSKTILDVRELINSRPLTGFQRALVLVGFLIIVFDGFDVVIMGFVAPQLKVAWGITHQALGGVLSAGLIGQALGATIAGPLADRYGRKIVITLSILWFGIWTLATAISTDVTMLVTFRFLTGLGLGASIPNTSTLIAEYAPARSRSLLVTLTLCGFTVGAAGGGFISAWMIPAFGWRSVLLLGGLAPISAAIFLMCRLPESVSYLIARQAPRDRIRAIVERLSPGVSNKSTVFRFGPSASVISSPVRILFLPKYRFGTAMLWVAYFSALFLVYLLSSWLPTIIAENDRYGYAEAAVAAAMFQVGGPVGSVCIGWAMDRWSKCLVLTGVFLCGGLAVFAIGQITANYGLLCFVVSAVGFCMNGGSVGLNALAASLYPTAARATGTCWMTGAGRVGATVSALAGGELLALGWSPTQVFGVLIAPALIASLAMAAQAIQSSRVTSGPARMLRELGGDRSHQQRILDGDMDSIRAALKGKANGVFDTMNFHDFFGVVCTARLALMKSPDVT
jgi:MFS transporter, AAHS family, 4-hydroxybenzoate transporter